MSWGVCVCVFTCVYMCVSVTGVEDIIASSTNGVCGVQKHYLTIHEYGYEKISS